MSSGNPPPGLRDKKNAFGQGSRPPGWFGSIIWGAVKVIVCRERTVRMDDVAYPRREASVGLLVGPNANSM
jgi:hypothetical protein